MTLIPNPEQSSIQTRPSLLNRLSTGDDAEGWQEFYRVYGKLVRDFAIKAGLSDTEADEVVQETAIAVSRHLPEFRYDPEVCRFKTWLLNQTSWRIKDQFRKRHRNERHLEGAAAGGSGSGATAPDKDRTANVERVPDPAGLNLDALFETEWRKNLLAAALEKDQDKIQPQTNSNLRSPCPKRMARLRSSQIPRRHPGQCLRDQTQNLRRPAKIHRPPGIRTIVIA